MITLKLKFSTDEDTKIWIAKVQRQYNSCFNVTYNYIFNHKDLSLFALCRKDSELMSLISKLNNVEMIDSFMLQCCIGDAYNAVHIKETSSPIVFGGKKLFFQRLKNQITKEEFREKKLRPFMVAENKVRNGNNKFVLTPDLNVLLRTSNKKSGLKELKLAGLGKRAKLLKDLYVKCLGNAIPVTYKLSKDWIWISFDESILYSDVQTGHITNRVMAIDINPNFVGWSVVDWKSSSEFDVIASGVFSMKPLNGLEKKFKGKGLGPGSKERSWLSNKRNHETLEISKKLIDIALHYKCQLFGIEGLDMKSGDKRLGRGFNKLVNNNWCRNALMSNLKKRCNIFKIKLLEVNPAYSSFIGNFVFRPLGTKYPDMVLSSIEIGRRAYEFYSQYVAKASKIQKNIIQPNVSDFKRLTAKSLEEFGLKDDVMTSLVDLYYFFKNSKIMYRVPLDLTRLKFSRQFPCQSHISYCLT